MAVGPARNRQRVPKSPVALPRFRSAGQTRPAGRRRRQPAPRPTWEELVVPAPVCIGLAGYGLGGRYFHAPLIASAANCEFLGVVTTSPERRRQVADDLGRPAFASREDLASARAEAVAISTPAATHVTLTQQALPPGL